MVFQIIQFIVTVLFIPTLTLRFNNFVKGRYSISFPGQVPMYVRWQTKSRQVRLVLSYISSYHRLNNNIIVKSMVPTLDPPLD